MTAELEGALLPASHHSSPSILYGENPLNFEVSLFLFQVVLIITTSRLIGYALKRLGQPPVISEILGGILLGPTVFGRIPGFSETVFPTESLPALSLMADLGKILYLFIVGMELYPMEIMKGFRTSAGISLAGILVPFVASLPVSHLIYNSYSDSITVNFWTFATFCGVALSTTGLCLSLIVAFPILIRIMADHKILSTNVGKTTISAAGFDDAIAWCLLMLVNSLVTAPERAWSAVFIVLAVCAWGLLLVFAVRPILVHLITSSSHENGADHFNVFVVFNLMCISATFVQFCGVDAIFGAFLVGLIIPHQKDFAIEMTGKIEDLIENLFLPIYFVFAGLSVQLGDLDSWKTWGLTLLIVTVACGGKLVGCSVAALFSGLSVREAVSVGVLMNSRGLVELIVLGVGLDKQIINGTIYSMFIVMALLTTFMTSPLISVIYPVSHRTFLPTAREDTLEDDDLKSPLSPYKPQSAEGTLDSLEPLPKLNLLVCLTESRSLDPTMQLVQLLFKSGIEFSVSALKLHYVGDRTSKLMGATNQSLNQDKDMEFFKIFAHVNNHTLKTVETYSALEKFGEDISEAASSFSSNLVLLCVSPANYPKGWGMSALTEISQSCTCPFAFVVDRGLGRAKSMKHEIFFPFTGSADDFEACVFLFYIASVASVSVHILAINVTDDQALEALQRFEGLGNISVEKVGPQSTVSLISRAALKDGTKLIVMISHQLYTSSTTADSFYFWLNHVSKSSIMIVKAPQPETAPTLPAAPAPNLGVRRILTRSTTVFSVETQRKRGVPRTLTSSSLHNRNRIPRDTSNTDLNQI
ncbi:K(+)/H(+) antiporter [Kappamyces sp. JEL0680]|nr:K(+)/H(+) antiporter [Kappamyces sp. JEL0680]